jgi:hypothetical protein
MATTCCLVDGHDDNPRTRKKISIPCSISPSLDAFFYIFEYPPARAKYTMLHDCRQTLVPHIFFAYKLVFSPAPSLRSTSTSVMPAFADPNLSFLPRLPITGVRTTSRRSAIHRYVIDATVISRHPFPFHSSYLFLSFSRALPYIYHPPNMMMLYIHAPAPHPLFYSISRNYMMLQ